MLRSTQKIIAIVVSASTLMLVMTALPIASVLRSYLQVTVLAGAIGVSAATMGWAKVRSNDSKLVAILIILAAVVFQVVNFLLLGLKLGFARNIYGWNLASICQIILPVVLLILAEEVLRGQLVEKGKGSLVAVIAAGVAIWLMMIFVSMPAYNLAEPKAIFTLLAVVAGPALLTNILLTYLAYVYDYRINIGYRLIMDLPVYLLPILPDAGVYLPALFQIGLVAILAIGLAITHRADKTAVFSRTAAVRKNKFARKVRRVETEQAKRVKRILKWSGAGLVAVGVLAYVTLMSGLFKYSLLAVGSGSMEPSLYRGDMVLVEKSDNYGKMREGEVLVYWYGEVVMVHRITEVMEENDGYAFQTKGDNNASNDNWQVPQADVIGLAKGRIAMLGYPTLWLNELFNGKFND